MVRRPLRCQGAQENAEWWPSHVQTALGGFWRGTGRRKGKPEVLEEQAKFHDLSGKMQARDVSSQRAAKTGNLDHLKGFRPGPLLRAATTARPARFPRHSRGAVPCSSMQMQKPTNGLYRFSMF